VKVNSFVRSEPKVVRPFIGIDNLEGALQEAMLAVRGVNYPPGNIILPESELEEIDLTFFPGFSYLDLVSRLNASSIPEVDVSLAIWIQGVTLKNTQIVFKQSLRISELFQSLQISNLANDRIINDLGGFDINLALVLQTSHQPTPLKPSQVGTWLAREKFRIRPERIETSFAPQPLTEPIRIQLSLPANVLSHIDISTDSLIDTEDLGQFVVCYVDADILEKIANEPSSPASLMLQTNFAVDLFTELIMAISSELGRGEKTIPYAALSNLDGSFGVGKLLARVEKKWKTDPLILLNIALSNPGRMRSIVAGHMGSMAAASALIKDEKSQR